MSAGSQSVEFTRLADRLASGRYLKTAKGFKTFSLVTFNQVLKFFCHLLLTRYISCTRDPNSGKLLQENLECPGDLVFANE